MTQFSKRILSAVLAVIMLLSMVPLSAMAAPASDLPDNMVDSPILRALEYTGYLTTDLSYKPPVDDGIKTEFQAVNEQITAKSETNLRTLPSVTDSEVVYTLKKGEYLTRTGISTNGWSRLEYNGQTVYAVSSYLTE